jgi:hypothetical protein
MAKLAGVSELNFGALAVAADSVAETETDTNMRPRLGPVASLEFKPTEWRYLVVFDQAPTQGDGTVKLYADGTLIASEAVAFNGNKTISNRVSVPVSAVSGEARLSVAMDVSTAADAGRVAEVQSILAVEQPLLISGC